MKTEREYVNVAKVYAGSIAPFAYCGAVILIVPFCVVFAMAAFFGAKTVHFNGTYLTGWSGLLVGVLLGPIFAAILGTFAWPAIYIGMRLWCWIFGFRFEYVPVDCVKQVVDLPKINSGSDPTIQN